MLCSQGRNIQDSSPCLTTIFFAALSQLRKFPPFFNAATCLATWLRCELKECICVGVTWPPVMIETMGWPYT